MLYLAICTEGESSEPAFINELDRVLGGQSINRSGTSVAVVPVPLNGIHGHSKIIEAANEALDLKTQRKLDGPLSDFVSGDELERWLICDYDYMEKHGVDLGEFRKMVLCSGYNLVINRPNFEFFVLTLLSNAKTASDIAPSDYEKEITNAIKSINNSNKTNKGFSEGMTIPKYSKKRYAAPYFFGKLLDYNPELIDKFCKIKFDKNSEHFSEMSDIITRIKSLRNGSN